MLTVQIKTKGHTYLTVERNVDRSAASWVAQQYMGPNGKYAVRIVNADGIVVFRAVPKAWA